MLFKMGICKIRREYFIIQELGLIKPGFVRTFGLLGLRVSRAGELLLAQSAKLSCVALNPAIFYRLSCFNKECRLDLKVQLYILQ